MLIVDFDYSWIFLLAGFIYFFINYMKYRNSNARHHHETETNKKMLNLRKIDSLVEHKRGLTNSRMIGENNTNVSSQSISEILFSNNLK